MCIIDGLVHATWSDGDQLVYGDGGSDSSSGLAAIGHLLLWLPWGSLVLTPFYLAACHWRHLPRTKVQYDATIYIINNGFLFGGWGRFYLFIFCLFIFIKIVCTVMVEGRRVGGVVYIRKRGREA